MRCPDCNKFVGFDEADPEIESLEVNEDGAVSISVRIVNCCADCGTELKEATFEMEADHSTEFAEHLKAEGIEETAEPEPHAEHELSIEEAGYERTNRSGFFKKGQFVPAGGRYAKTFYGAEVSYEICCSCGKFKAEGSLNDDVQASGMDEMV